MRARGVEYLHSLANECFIHRDLKPSNILLGNDMRAKVSDFGLVKSTPIDGIHSVETRMAGTFGYLAPEYATSGTTSPKADVYAFGVVLMEILSGKKALGGSLPEGMNLAMWFREAIDNKQYVGTYLDPCLDSSQEMPESFSVVTDLAMHCTARKPASRPDMSHVVNVLARLVERWNPSNSDEEATNTLGFDDISTSI